MSVTRKVVRWGALRAARRAAVSVPFAGTAIALLVAGAAVRRKGLVGGTIETALNATPIVGALKNIVELYRGDLIPDKPQSLRAPAPPTSRPPASAKRK